MGSCQETPHCTRGRCLADTFKQIEIYGCDGVNYALPQNGGSALQSTMHGTGDPWGPAECVIDGNRRGCSNHTKHLPNGWLEVTLEQPRSIESFAIFNMEDDNYDHRMRLRGHTVSLLDEAGREVYREVISAEFDSALFDQSQGCRQLFVNEDAKAVVATLVFEEESEGQAAVTALRMSGEPLATVQVDVKRPGIAAELCYRLEEAAGVPAYNLRLVFPDGPVLRLHCNPELQDKSLADLLPRA